MPVRLGYVMTLCQWHFLTNENGQDLVEYSLLLAFIMFTLIGLTIGIKGSVQGITSMSNSQISYANTMVS
jgi:Flp pilus assembly pilin Flp